MTNPSAEATRFFPNSCVAADFDHIVIWGRFLKMVKAHSRKLDVRSTMDGLEVSILLDVAAEVLHGLQPDKGLV